MRQEQPSDRPGVKEAFQCTELDSGDAVSLSIAETREDRDDLLDRYAEGQGEAFVTLFTVKDLPALALSATEAQATRVSAVVDGRVVKVGKGAP